MPPKRKTQPEEVLPLEERRELEKSEELRDSAYRLGICGKTNPVLTSPSLRPHAAWRSERCPHKDVTRKNQQRKRRLLMVFPGELSLGGEGGRIGHLSRLDTRNPLLSIPTEKGTLHLDGTILYPKDKNPRTATFGRGNKCVIEDSVEEILVFSRAYWNASGPGTPGLATIPSDALSEQRPEGVVPYGGAADYSRSTISTVSSSVSEAKKSESDLVKSVSTSQGSRRSSRAVKKIRYAEDGEQLEEEGEEVEEGEEEEEEDEDEDDVVKVTQTQGNMDEASDSEIVELKENDEEEEQPVKRGRPPKRSSSTRGRNTIQPSTSRQGASSRSEVSATGSSRRRNVSAPKSYVEVSEDEDDNVEDEDDHKTPAKKRKTASRKTPTSSQKETDSKESKQKRQSTKTASKEGDSDDNDTFLLKSPLSKRLQLNAARSPDMDSAKVQSTLSSIKSKEKKKKKNEEQATNKTTPITLFFQNKDD